MHPGRIQTGLLRRFGGSAAVVALVFEVGEGGVGIGPVGPCCRLPAPVVLLGVVGVEVHSGWSVR